ncbi:MAG: flagellar biosynthesis protein FlgA, partial [Geodermatophilaceae bacterium]|nr:flagellar biosynthesis protein FlgA [Geodermatophilaceae bacterium]
GVLLVLVSVLVGARIISAADQSVSVWAAAEDLSAGTTLRADDVRAVPVRLFGSAASYLQASAELSGQILDRPVRAGELVPASALRRPSDRVSVALPVASSAVPLDLRRGQLVDVYATGEDGAGEGIETRLVLAAAPVQAIDGGSQGALSASSGTRQVVVSVPSDEAGELLAAIAGRELAVAILEDPSEPVGRAVPTRPPGVPAASSATAPATSTAAPAS